MIRPGRSSALLPPLLVLVLAGSGCRDNAVEYRVVPRETAAPAQPMAPPHGPMAGTASAAGPVLEWTAPEAWTPLPASEMRLASYEFKSPEGEVADISVFSFPDAAGGLVANINRWRNQVGLEPVADAQVETTATRTDIAGQAAWLVDFAGTPKPSAQMMGGTPPPTGLTRIIGAIIPIQGKSWFFKVMGPDAVVASQRENFQQFVTSIRAVTPAPQAARSGADPHAGVAGAPPMAGAAGNPHAGVAGAPPIGAGAGDPHAGVAGAPPIGTMDPSGIAAPPTPAAGFSFETPAGWEAQAASQFRLASFKVPGNGVPPADVSVTNFPGTVGGDFANINRWRGQLGLPPISEAEFASSVQRIRGQHDMEFIVADIESAQPMIEGRPARMLAAILKVPDSTFFFKMTGETALVASQREAFLRFLQSFHIDDGHAH